jgi:hypothetical protein
MNESPKSGRPPELTDKQIDELLQALTDGAPLSSIVEGDEWPSYRSIFRRLEKDDDFRNRYDRARAIQAERWADELITLANSLREDATAEQIAATKLKIDTLKWIIGKRLPKLYGDAPSSSVNISSSTHNYLVISVEKQRELQERRARALRDVKP